MSDVFLMLQSSSGNLAVGLARDGRLIHDTTDDAALARSRDIRGAIAQGLEATGLSLADLTRIHVDIGPGGLGATRGSVAFANALGYAADLPVIGVPAFELLGLHASGVAGTSAWIARRAARPRLFLGRYDRAGGLQRFGHVTEEAAARAIAEDPEPVALTGNMSFARDGVDLDPLANAAPMQCFLDLVRSPAYLTRTDRSAAPITETL